MNAMFKDEYVSPGKNETVKTWTMTYYECCCIPCGKEVLELYQTTLVIRKGKNIARTHLRHITSIVTRRAPLGWERFFISNVISAIVGLVVMYLQRKQGFFWIWFLLIYCSIAIVMVFAMILFRPLQLRIGVLGHNTPDDFAIDLLPFRNNDDQEDIVKAIRENQKALRII